MVDPLDPLFHVNFVEVPHVVIQDQEALGIHKAVVPPKMKSIDGMILGEPFGDLSAILKIECVPTQIQVEKSLVLNEKFLQDLAYSSLAAS